MVTRGSSDLRKQVPVKTLALIWVVLCANLVFTRIELVFVFFSFMGSVVLASMLPMVLHPRNHVLIRNSIGIAVCVVASILITKSKHLSSTQSYGGNVESQLPEFQALALITGYLVFKLWYTVHPLCNCKPVLLRTIWEDALTLSIFVTILVKLRPAYILEQYCPSALAWISYKICRLFWEINHFHISCNKKTGKASSNVVVSSSDQVMNQVSCGTTTTNPPNSIVEKNLWVIHGVVFDLSDFVRRHPGGVQAIELGRGRDCTALFESYHPFTEKQWEVLEKYKSPHVDLKKLKIASMDPFYDALKRRVFESLNENGVDPLTKRGATPGRTVYYLVTFTGLLISAVYHVKGYIIGSLVFAIFGWLIGALGHDAGHFAVSRRAWINDVCLWGISALCNPVMWQHQHTFAHHSHTNEFENDPDLHHFERLLRVHRQFKYEAIYAYQRNSLYVLFSYSLVVLGTCLWIPIHFLKDGTLYGIVDFTNRSSIQVRIASLFHSVSYIAIILVAPFMNTGPLRAAACGIIHIATAGLLFAFFSQINHVNEVSFPRDKEPIMSPDSTFESPNENISRCSWAAKQIQSSNNFATSSLFWHVLSNGLNMQIEHHLFPGLNHCHLHTVKRAVRETCKEYGVEYKEHESFGQILKATLSWLDVLSKPS